MAYQVIDKGQLVSDLKAHVVEIIFDNMDGDRRIMNCTLIAGFLPEEFRSHDAITKSVNATDGKTLHVWDCNPRINNWRTIKLDRIVSAQITNH